MSHLSSKAATHAGKPLVPYADPVDQAIERAIQKCTCRPQLRVRLGIYETSVTYTDTTLGSAFCFQAKFCVSVPLTLRRLPASARASTFFTKPRPTALSLSGGRAHVCVCVCVCVCACVPFLCFTSLVYPFHVSHRVRVLRDHVMVRIGGGWDTFEAYLEKIDPCQRAAVTHSPSSRSPSKESLSRSPVKDAYSAQCGLVSSAPMSVGAVSQSGPLPSSRPPTRDPASTTSALQRSAAPEGFARSSSTPQPPSLARTSSSAARSSGSQSAKASPLARTKSMAVSRVPQRQSPAADPQTRRTSSSPSMRTGKD
jgi:hypothetical protein